MIVDQTLYMKINILVLIILYKNNILLLYIILFKDTINYLFIFNIKNKRKMNERQIFSKTIF